MFCIRINILYHRNNIVLFLACNMAALQNLYTRVFNCNIEQQDKSLGLLGSKVTAISLFMYFIFAVSL